MKYEMPRKLAEALGKAQREMPNTLKKDSNNQYHKYAYASIDAYYENMRDVLINHGIMIMPSEVSNELRIAGKDAWMVYVFEFIIMHESGEVWNKFIKRSVSMRYADAQTAGQALSYAEKFFLRTLFKMPTGEEDPDANKQESAPPSDDNPAAKAQGKAKKATTPEYDFAGEPYRVILPNGSVDGEFTSLDVWGKRLKAMLEKGSTTAEANEREIERVLKHLADDGSITDAKRKKYVESINTLRNFGKGDSNE